MIKIRYRDPSELSPGLHAAAERHGRSTVIYLISGLTAPQRRAALRRLRLSARMGYCPELPTAQLGLALLADGIRTALGRAGAVFRLHPAGSAVPIVVASAIAFLVLSTVSMRVLHSPQLPGKPPAGADPSATAPASASPGAVPSPAPPPVTRQRAADTGHVTSARSGPGRSPSPPTRPGPGRGTPGNNTPTGTGSATPAPGSSATVPPDQPPSPTSPTPRAGSPWPTPSTSVTPGLCLGVGPFGVCLGR